MSAEWSEINERDMLNLIIKVEQDLINYKNKSTKDDRVLCFLQNVDILLYNNGANANDMVIYIDSHIFGKRYIEYKENSKNNIKSVIEVIKNKAKEMYNIVNNTDKCVNVSLHKKANNESLELCYITADKEIVLATSQSLPIPELTFKSRYYMDIREHNSTLPLYSHPNILRKQKLDVHTNIIPIVKECTKDKLSKEGEEIVISVLSALWGNGDYNFFLGGFWWFYETVDAGHNSEHIFNVLEEAFNISSVIKHFDTEEEAIQHYLTIGLAVFAHDMFSYINRKDHHILAKEYLLDLSKVKGYNNVYNSEYLKGQEIKYIINCLNYFTKKMLIDAANMVAEHRASFTGDFTNINCEILAAADRGKPDVLEVVNRIYTCALDSNCVFNVDIKGFENHIIFIDNKIYESQPIINRLIAIDKWTNQQVKTFYHLWEKYSKNGYAFNKLKENGVYLTYYKDSIKDFWNLIDKIIVNPNLMLEMLRLRGNING